ncbi:hypothetical protein N7509_005068 [Penicillium cosmopolitanum]|uniref:Glycolipid transfer protein domain-containing protein n=1 Tax=Penicillium cosmopolitanum TaxID=1131564 RepID=A0A9W9W1N3_9EURO|nr:uncharacterized protein N7509_005068 [Penicillium cosmopolitanum]KAJ5396955.1 hypothetical protein N7509_005068 [Penicillium cosmopolitanum]
MSTSWLESIKGQSFENVTVDASGNINTEEFIRAAKSLVTLFERIGGIALNSVKDDMTNNIAVCPPRLAPPPPPSPREALQRGSRRVPDLQDLVKNDKSKKAAQGLFWLKLALDLTATAIRRNLDDPVEELNTSFTSAYNDVLKPHHNFLAKKAFGFAMNSVPYRKDFYAKIGVSPYELSAEQEQFSAEQLKGVKDQLNSPLTPEIAALKNVVTILNNFDDLTKCK